MDVEMPSWLGGDRDPRALSSAPTPAGHAYPVVDRPSGPSRTARSRTEPGMALAVLASWQRAGFRAYVMAERRSDRRSVVHALLAKLGADDLNVPCTLLVADETAKEQWESYLSGADVRSATCFVQTAESLLSDGTKVASDVLIVADELEAYLSDDLASALTSARAVLGLCATPRGMAGSSPLRRHIGSLLTPSSADALDFQALAHAVRPSSESDDGEVPEQLLNVGDPEDLLGLYLTETQRFPLLTAEEEITLAKQIEAGVFADEELANDMSYIPRSLRRELREISEIGAAARERFLTCNLRLVYSIARRYSMRIEIMDAIQEGNLGLIRAVQKFDYTKGYKFSTYASWWIRQAISRAVADTSLLIRVPVHQYESDSPILVERRRRDREYESVEARDIAEALDLDIAEVEGALRRHRRPLSLELMAEADIDIYDPAADDLEDQISVEGLQHQVAAVLSTLSEREAGVMKLRHGLVDGNEHTLDEIGQVYGVTRERIRQIESKSLTKLREFRRSEVLRGYLTDEDPERRNTRPKKPKTEDAIRTTEEADQPADDDVPDAARQLVDEQVAAYRRRRPRTTIPKADPTIDLGTYYVAEVFDVLKAVAAKHRATVALHGNVVTVVGAGTATMLADAPAIIATAHALFRDYKASNREVRKEMWDGGPDGRTRFTLHEAVAWTRISDRISGGFRIVL